MVFRQYPVFLAPVFFLMGIPNISGVFQYFFQPFPKLNLNCYTVDSCSLFFHGLPLSSLWLCLCTILTTMGPLVELEGMWLRWMVDWLIHSFSFFFLPSNLHETSWRKLWRNVLSWDNILINTRFLIHQPIATLGSILDSQLSWESGKFQLARWSHGVVLFLVRSDPTNS